MNRAARKTNLVFGTLLLIGVVSMFVLYQNPDDPGKFGAAAVFVLMVGVVIAWVIQLFIDHRAAKLPPTPLTPIQQQRYKRNRILVAIGIILFILSPFLLGH